MRGLTKEQLIKTGFQDKMQFGSRVETPSKVKGIVNYFNLNDDECRVYGSNGPEMCKILECRLLSVDEAFGV